MNRNNLFAALTGWLALALAPSSPAAVASSTDSLAAESAGIVSGRVSNEATGAYLAGATVQIEGSALMAVTATDGSFLLRVPPGRHELVATYTGLNSGRKSIVVDAGGRMVQNFDLTAEFYQLAAFVVAGEREGNAAAIMQQRTALNIKNVISTDAFGSLAGNPADLLEKVTGITVDRVGGDIRGIMIRGVSDTFNSVQIDGARVANINVDRGFQFQNIGSDHIESIELIKASTPDMDADAIGGTVNLKSRSAFNLKGRRISYSLGGIVGYERDRGHPAGTFSYSNVHNAFGGKNNLGISFTAGWRQHLVAIDGATPNYNNALGFMFSLNYRDQAITRTRYGGGLKIDYKLSDEASVFLNLTAAPHRENSHTRTVILQGNQTVGATGTASVVPGFTSTLIEFRPVAGSTIQLQEGFSHRMATSYASQFGGAVRTRGYELDYDLTYSAAINKPYNDTATMSLAGIGFRFEKDNPDAELPRVTYTAGPDTFNLGNYTFQPRTRSQTRINSYMRGGQINLKRPLDLPAPAALKTGFKFRQQLIDRSNSSTSWTSPGLELTQFTNTAYRYAPFAGLYAARPFVSVHAMVADAEKNPTRWIESPTLFTQNWLTNRQEFDEKVASGYLQGSVRIDRLSILAGLRVERTEVTGEGSLQQITPEERARRAAWVGAVTPDEARRRVVAEFGQRRKSSSEYRDLFPGIHFTYKLGRSAQARASYSNGIARPDPTNLMPLDLVNDDAMTVRANNTKLKPQYGQNFDVSLEYYFEPSGLVSAGVFYKEINDFIYSSAGQSIGTGATNGFDGQYAGYSLTSSANGGFAHIKGLELNYQQQFNFLPGWWKGFGAFANYTKLETKGDYGSRGDVREAGSLPGFVPKAVNAGISYIWGKVSLRLQYANNAGRLAAYNVDPRLRRWDLKTRRIDIKAKYFWRPSLSFYFDAYNITGDDYRQKLGSGALRIIEERHDPQFHFGIEGRF